MTSEPDYRLLAKQVAAVAEEDPRWVPALSNTSALIGDALDDINWAGFYIRETTADGSDRLVLGPFQGKVACVHIGVGHGVCGTAVAENATQLVTDVHSFPGHIACDAASNSEVVIPIHDGAGRVAAVLDIDSPTTARFTQADADGLEQVVAYLEQVIRLD